MHATTGNRTPVWTEVHPIAAEMDHVVSLACSDLPGWEIRVEFSPAGNVCGIALRALFDGEMTVDYPFTIPSGGATSRRIREVRWMEAEQHARAVMARRHATAERLATETFVVAREAGPGEAYPMLQGGGPGSELETLAKQRSEQFTAGDRPKPGPKGRTELEWARVAAEYVEVLAGPGGRAPNKVIAERHHVNTSTVRGWIESCTERGLLAGRTRGRPGGVLTDKAIDLLSVEREPEK